MNNVTILRIYETLTGYTWGWSWGGFITGFIALCVFGISIYFIVKKRKVSIIAGALAIATFISLMATACFSIAKPIYETRYDAYLEGAVDMTQFTQRYEVVRQDNLLFTLRDSK